MAAKGVRIRTGLESPGFGRGFLLGLLRIHLLSYGIGISTQHGARAMDWVRSQPAVLRKWLRRLGPWPWQSAVAAIIESIRKSRNYVRLVT
jgi:hypothetical protein